MNHRAGELGEPQIMVTPPEEEECTDSCDLEEDEEEEKEAVGESSTRSC